MLKTDVHFWAVELWTYIRSFGEKKNESYVEELGSCFNNLKYGRIILRILLIIG